MKQLKNWLTEQIYLQIYTELIPVDTILWPWCLVQKQSQLHMDLTRFLHKLRLITVDAL